MEVRKWCMEYYCYQIISAFVADSTEEVDITINIIKELMELEQSAQQSGEEGILLKDPLERKCLKDQPQLLKVLAIFCCKLWKKGFQAESDSILVTVNDYINFLYDVCLPNDDRKQHMTKAANAQRVLELSRSNKKRTAKKLFDELERKEGCLHPKDLKAVIYASHEMPQHLTYESFMSDMKEMVAAILETFTTPFLVGLANVVEKHPGFDLKIDIFLSSQKKHDRSKEAETSISKGHQPIISCAVLPGPSTRADTADLSVPPKTLTAISTVMCSKEATSNKVPQKQKKATFLSFKTYEMWKEYTALSFSSSKPSNEAGKADGTHTAGGQNQKRMDLKNTEEQGAKKVIEQKKKRNKEMRITVTESSSAGDDNLDTNKDGSKEKEPGEIRVSTEHSNDDENSGGRQRGTKRLSNEISRKGSGSNRDDLNRSKEGNKKRRNGESNADGELSNDNANSNERQGSMRRRNLEIPREDSSPSGDDLNRSKEGNKKRRNGESNADGELCNDNGNSNERRRNKEMPRKDSSPNGDDLNRNKEGSKKRRNIESKVKELSDDNQTSNRRRRSMRQTDRVARSGEKRTREGYDNSENECNRNKENKQRVNGEGTRGEQISNNFKRILGAAKNVDDDKNVDDAKGDDRSSRSRGLMELSCSSCSTDFQDLSSLFYESSDNDIQKENAGKTSKTSTPSKQGCSSGQDVLSRTKDSSKTDGPLGKDSGQEHVSSRKHNPNETKNSNDSFSEGESVQWTPEKDSTRNTVNTRQGARQDYITHRRRRPFSPKEEAYLREGVQRFGVGKWAVILENYPFENRTSVNLKDKHRNLVKNGALYL